MNRKYFIRYPRNFANEYQLAWCYDIPVGGDWQRITRGEALFFAKREAERRKDDPSFAGYADTIIAPIDYSGEYLFGDWAISQIVQFSGRVWCGWYYRGHIISPVD